MTEKDDPVLLLQSHILAMVRGKEPDFTLRQLAILLVCNSSNDPQTVRGLAKHLAMQKPVVTRSADRLEEAGLLRRKPDPADRRSVLIVVTQAGKTYCRRFGMATDRSMSQREKEEGRTHERP